MAEEIGYSIVGEQREEPANVIGYAIVEQQNTQTNMVNNASSITSTGDASVVPGINDYKLLDQTSIYSLGNDGLHAVGTITTQDDGRAGTKDFTKWEEASANGQWDRYLPLVEFPSTGRYYIHYTIDDGYAEDSPSYYQATFQAYIYDSTQTIKKATLVEITKRLGQGTVVVDAGYDAEVGDVLTLVFRMYNTSSGRWLVGGVADITLDITKEY